MATKCEESLLLVFFFNKTSILKLKKIYFIQYRIEFKNLLVEQRIYFLPFDGRNATDTVVLVDMVVFVTKYFSVSKYRSNTIVLIIR